ncbi:hypothetical protein Tco_0864471 [Tanacetum coccineum]
MSAATKALIVAVAAALPSSPPPSPLTLLARFTALTFGFKIGESSPAAAAKQPVLDVATVDATLGHIVSREVGYGIDVVWDDMVGDMEERAPTTDDRALQRARVNTLFRERRYHLHTAVLVESEVRCAKKAQGQAMGCNWEVHAELQAYRAQVQTYETHI